VKVLFADRRRGDGIVGEGVSTGQPSGRASANGLGRSVDGVTTRCSRRRHEHPMSMGARPLVALRGKTEPCTRFSIPRGPG
jgi:hypothetical protein